jgi:hypothetical protein
MNDTGVFGQSLALVAALSFEGGWMKCSQMGVKRCRGFRSAVFDARKVIQHSADPKCLAASVHVALDMALSDGNTLIDRRDAAVRFVGKSTVRSQEPLQVSGADSYNFHAIGCGNRLGH